MIVYLSMKLIMHQLHHTLGNLQAGHPQDMNADAVGIIYEVRVYSLEAPTLGEVLHARQIKAAHCLTSVQFSPTSEHLLLAYGRSEVLTRRFQPLVLFAPFCLSAGMQGPLHRIGSPIRCKSIY